MRHAQNHITLHTNIDAIAQLWSCSQLNHKQTTEPYPEWPPHKRLACRWGAHANMHTLTRTYARMYTHMQLRYATTLSIMDTRCHHMPTRNDITCLLGITCVHMCALMHALTHAVKHALTHALIHALTHAWTHECAQNSSDKTNPYGLRTLTSTENSVGICGILGSFLSKAW